MQHNYSALIFSDKSVIYGKAVGAVGKTAAELCFTTALTGYQEAITDPSYSGQGIVFSFPHIGNTGVNDIDLESSRPHAKLIVARNEVSISSNQRANNNLESWLKDNGVFHLYDFDTRAIMKKIAKIQNKNCVAISKSEDFVLTEEEVKSLSEEANQYQIKFEDSMSSILSDKEREAEIKKIVDSSKGFKKKIAVVDYGVKLNILRLLVETGLNIEVLKCTTDLTNLFLDGFDGFVLSNGPADPQDAIALNEGLLKAIFDTKKPILGICLGHQILGMFHPKFMFKVAKMPQGHRGINHPILNLVTKKVEITSQNHGYNVYIDDETKLCKASHKSLFDGSIAGISDLKENIISVQYHPESSPGTHDSRYIFDDFKKMVMNYDDGKGQKKFDQDDGRNLNVLEKKLAYNFKSKDLLHQSLRHPSVQRNQSYEKFEFIGDKILNSVLAEALLRRFPKNDEGKLSLKLNHLVSGKMITKIATNIDLSNFIEMPEHEKRSSGHFRASNLEDCMEAVLGGVFLDSDFETTKKVILRLWKDFLNDSGSIEKDPKSQLQEWLQKNQKDLPEYVLVEKSGPSHSPHFTIELKADGLPPFKGDGLSMKEAESKAADLAIEYINQVLLKSAVARS